MMPFDGGHEVSAFDIGSVAYVLKRRPGLSETYIVNEIRAMERIGSQIMVYSLSPPEPPPHQSITDDADIPLHYLPGRFLTKLAILARAHLSALLAAPRGYASALWRAYVWSAVSLTPVSVWTQFLRAGFLATACRRNRVRHIHTYSANDPAQVAHFASLMSAVPFSITAHAGDLRLTSMRVLRWRARAAVFISASTACDARYLREVLSVNDKGKVRLVHHGIDLTAYKPVRDKPLGSSVNCPFLVLSVGDLVPEKAHDDLISACTILRDEGHYFRCIIVGTGPERGSLQALIDFNALGSVVTLAGSMTHMELIELYRRADLFAVASRLTDDGAREGILNEIVEAMAIGAPVVATTISGIPELVRDRQTGLLVPENSPNALAGAIGWLMTDPDRAERFARAARALVEREFDLSTTVAQLHSLIGRSASVRVGSALTNCAT